MRYAVVAQTPAMARELARHFAASARQRGSEIARARGEQGTGRYRVIDAGFPAARYLIWDTKRNDNLRGADLPGNPRHPWFCRPSLALRIASKLNRADGRLESLSYGVTCSDCGEWETACRCEQ